MTPFKNGRDPSRSPVCESSQGEMKAGVTGKAELVRFSERKVRKSLAGKVKAWLFGRRRRAAVVKGEKLRSLERIHSGTFSAAASMIAPSHYIKPPSHSRGGEEKTLSG